MVWWCPPIACAFINSDLHYGFAAIWQAIKKAADNGRLYVMVSPVGIPSAELLAFYSRPLPFGQAGIMD